MGESPRQERSRRIPSAVRAIVIARDGVTCAECGVECRPVQGRARTRRRVLSIDHKVPFSLGGSHTEDNLRVLCFSCNARRGNRYLGDVE